MAILLVAPLMMARPAQAVDQPFDAGLMRLAEVLGSLHFLRNLCGEKGDQWRGLMERLLAAENPDEERRARFVANFNRGYRSFEAPIRVAPPRRPRRSAGIPSRAKR